MYLERRGLPICALIEVLSCGLRNDGALTAKVTAKPMIDSNSQRTKADNRTAL